MKLLLTSNGLSNQSIATALFKMVGKTAAETTIAFIPTAANVGKNDKGWLVNDLYNIEKQDLKCLDIVDISALPKEEWLPRLEAADVLFFSGGNTYHLMRWLDESGLTPLLPKLLETRVYAGISAGSIVTNPDLALSSKDKQIYYEEQFGFNSDKGLGFVDFYFRPHFNSSHFPHAAKDYLESIAKDIPGIIYALDDNSALRFENGELEIISEGEYLILNK